MPSFSALVRPCAEHPSVWLLVSASLLDLELVVVEPKFVPALFGEAGPWSVLFSAVGVRV